MMVEVEKRRVVSSTDINDGDQGVVHLLGRRLAAKDGSTMSSGEQADGEKVIFVSAAGMGQNAVNHDAGNLLQIELGSRSTGGGSSVISEKRTPRAGEHE